MPRNKAATMLDVARMAGVSRSAVSKVVRNAYGVSPEMRARVEGAIASLGYRPNLSARAIRGASMTLGFELRELETSALLRILLGATRAAHRAGYQLVVAPSSTSESRTGYEAIEALVDLHVDGIIAVAPLVDPEWLEQLAERVPTVLLSRHDNSRHYDTMTGNDAAGATLAMEHLFGLGHHRIAHLTRGQDTTPPGLATTVAVRLTTYEQLMAQHAPDADLRVVRTPVGSRDGYECTIDLLRARDRPTAVFAATDDLAFDALRALTDLGLDAHDVSVVGYDNTPLAAHPRLSLTSVDQAGEELGDQAVRLLIERLEGRTRPKHRMTKPKLFARGSTTTPTPEALADAQPAPTTR